MNNDLISRSTLKKDMKSRLSACNEWIEKAKDKETKIRASTVKAFIAEVIMTIDKAPTVELTESEVQEVLNKRCMTAVANEYLIALHGKTERPKESELVKAYLQGFNTGVEIVKNARLQGEWLFVSRNCWKCPYCQELTNEGKNFCPNCGAYMRGENNG